MMERLATYFLLITLVSLAEADFTVSSKRDMSNSASWRCGFFLVSASDGLPRATYFVVQQHFPAQCPAKIFRTRNMERDCKIQGQNWGSKWAPEQGGARGRNGDRICQIASKELRASNIPNEEFPLGLQIAALYNHCGNKEWKDSKYRRTERICCEDGLFVSCKGRI
eukprot:TRINITY_DN5399_c0_g1_i1.p1 TRINITY_DN5399_c0_g1~~TRINITY_DN5399_c0_g1_i1.p1  ORF type:complete len:167 (+),score=37.62 TRINITY_DN5399_c0_g1_i1:75-575(+)